MKHTKHSTRRTRLCYREIVVCLNSFCNSTKSRNQNHTLQSCKLQTHSSKIVTALFLIRVQLIVFVAPAKESIFPVLEFDFHDIGRFMGDYRFQHDGFLVHKQDSAPVIISFFSPHMHPVASLELGDQFRPVFEARFRYSEKTLLWALHSSR